MLKKLFKTHLIYQIIILGIFLFICWIIYGLILNPIRQTPYPFIVLDNPLSEENEYQMANEADLLIIGDQLACSLKQYEEGLIKIISHNLEKPLVIYNWCRPNEGIHRTLFKIKQLPSLPKLIIYHGTQSEFWESLFDIKDSFNILTDLKIFENPYLASAIIIFPTLSKIIYHHQKIKKLKAPIADTNTYNARGIQTKIEIIYKLYSYQFQDLLKYIRAKKSHLFVINAPLNLSLPPLQTCSNTTSQKIDTYLNEIQQLLDKGESKTAYTHLIELQKNIPSNAKVYYLLGQTLTHLGRLEEARNILEKVSSYDCDLALPKSVFNAIQQKLSHDNQIVFIDFNHLVNMNYGRDELFLSEHRPQSKYYEILVSILAKNIMRLLHL